MDYLVDIGFAGEEEKWRAILGGVLSMKGCLVMLYILYYDTNKSLGVACECGLNFAEADLCSARASCSTCSRQTDFDRACELLTPF